MYVYTRIRVNLRTLFLSYSMCIYTYVYMYIVYLCRKTDRKSDHCPGSHCLAYVNVPAFYKEGSMLSILGIS